LFDVVSGLIHDLPVILSKAVHPIYHDGRGGPLGNSKDPFHAGAGSEHIGLAGFAELVEVSEMSVGDARGAISGSIHLIIEIFT